MTRNTDTVVGTGSMWPYTQLLYEGYANFFDAVMLAASPASRNRGGMVASNTRIILGNWATKLYSTNPNTSGANTGGDLRLFINSLPVFYNSLSRTLFKHYFDIDAVSAHSSFPGLPKVDILYAACGPKYAKIVLLYPIQACMVLHLAIASELGINETIAQPWKPKA